MSLTQPLLEALARALGHFLWQGALIGALAYAVFRVVRPSASVRYLIGVGALGLMAAAPVVTTAVLLRDAAATGLGLAALAEVSGRFVARWAPDPAASAGVHWTAATTIVALWSLGVMGLSLRLLGGWAMTRRFVARSRNLVSPEVRAFARRLCAELALGSVVDVVESPSAVVPMLVGWLKPVVILPTAALASLAPAQVEALLAHELAHVRRHDYLVNLFQSVVEALLFYHPAVWLVSRDVRQAREECCDDLAVLVCDRVVYASALADLAALSVTPVLALAATDGSLLLRVRRILGGPDGTRPSRPGWLPASVLALAIAAIVPLALSSAPAQEPRVSPAPPAATSTPVVTVTESREPASHVLLSSYLDSPESARAVEPQDPVLTPAQIDELRAELAAVLARQGKLKLEQGEVTDQLRGELVARLAQLSDMLAQAGVDRAAEVKGEIAKLKALKSKLPDFDKEDTEKELVEKALTQPDLKSLTDDSEPRLKALKQAEETLGRENQDAALAKVKDETALAQAEAELAERQSLDLDEASRTKIKTARLNELKAELAAREADARTGGDGRTADDIANLKAQLDQAETALGKLTLRGDPVMGTDKDGKGLLAFRMLGRDETPLDAKETLAVLGPVVEAGPNDVSVVGTFKHPGHVTFHDGLTVAEALKAAGAPAIGDAGIHVRRLSELQVTFGAGGPLVSGRVDEVEAASHVRPGDVLLVTRASK